MEKTGMEKAVREGANWFYWIAGLSVVNSISLAMGGKWSFVIGLGFTQFIDAAAQIAFDKLGSTLIKLFGFGLDLCVIGLFILFGYLANKKYRWSFMVGMILYTLDGLVYLTVSDFLSVGFHAFALFFIFRGYKALGEMKRMDFSTSYDSAGLQNAPPVASESDLSQ